MLGAPRPVDEAVVRGTQRELRRHAEMAAEAREREQKIAELVGDRAAIPARDMQVVTGFTLVASIMVVLGNLLSDILYALVDPRVRYS